MILIIAISTPQNYLGYNHYYTLKWSRPELLQKQLYKKMTLGGFDVGGPFSDEYCDHLGFHGHHYLIRL